MAISSESTFDEARAAYYANRDYDVGNGTAIEFRRAAELLLELIPSRTGNRDGETEMELSHIRKALERVNAWIDQYEKVSPVSGRSAVKYLKPVRG